MYRITQAVESLFVSLPVPPNSTVKQSGRKIGAATTCPSRFDSQSVSVFFSDNEIILFVNYMTGKTKVTMHMGTIKLLLEL